MRLEGSCHCGAVRFSVESHEPVPFMRCYCSICRKTAGMGGFAINLGADFATLQVEGREHLAVYRAVLGDGRRSTGQRHFCRVCGIYPFHRKRVTPSTRMQCAGPEYRAISVLSGAPRNPECTSALASDPLKQSEGVSLSA